MAAARWLVLGAVLAALPAWAGSGPTATASPDAGPAVATDHAATLAPDHPAQSVDVVAPDDVPSWVAARPPGLRLTARGGAGANRRADVARAPTPPPSWTSFRRKQPPLGDGDDPACPS
jgi:hypothetical protein